MNKALTVLIVVMLVGLTACGPTASTDNQTPTTTPPTQTPAKITTTPPPPSTTPTIRLNFTNDDWPVVIAEAHGAQQKYIGTQYISMVNLYGTVTQIFSNGFTFDTDLENPSYSNNRTWVFTDVVQGLKEGSWVKVEGLLIGYWSTQTVLGAPRYLPEVAAYSSGVTIVTRSEAIKPLVTVNIGKILSQHGLEITLEKIEICKDETRVYVGVFNGTSNKASLYDFEIVIVQGQKQIKIKSIFGNEDEPDSTLVAGTRTEGIFVFEKMDPSIRLGKLIWGDPRTDDYYKTFSDWIWEFAW